MTRNNGEAAAAPSRSQQNVAQLIMKPPPHAIELEMCLLGSLLIEAMRVDEVTPIIGPSDFYKPVHGAIFAEIVRIYEEYKEFDIALLHQRLIDRDILDAVGGQD